MQSPDYVKLKLAPKHQALVAQLTRLEVEHNLLEVPLLNLYDKVSGKEQGGGADAEGNQDTPREIDKKDQLRVEALSMAENEAEKVFILRQWRREQNLKNATSECVKTCQKLLVHSKFNSALRAAQVQSLTTGAGQSLSSYKEPVEAVENVHAQSGIEPSSKEARYREATSRVTDPLFCKLLRKRKDTPNEERSHANEDHVVVANIISAQDVELAERRAVSSYKPKRGLKFKLGLALSTLLSLLYVPVTNQALAVVFCSYDCYNDTTHQTLVVVGIFVLIITLGAPVLFFVIIGTVVKQYHTYLGVFQTDIQVKNWPVFVDNVDNPFSSLYAVCHHHARFFNPATLMFRALISAAIVGLPAESASQLISCLVLQLLYATISLWTRSFRRDFVNIVVGIAQIYVVLIMMLRAIQLLEPENGDVGIAMVVISTIALVFQIIFLLVVITQLIKKILSARKDKKKNEEDKEKFESARASMMSVKKKPDGGPRGSGRSGGARRGQHEE